MDVKVKRLSPTAILPTRGSSEAAGWDLYADIPYRTIIHDGETISVKTGIAIEIPKGYFGAIFARSGLATKQGLRPANCVGVIDSDYRGEIIVAIHNDQIDIQMITPGMRIAQLVIIPIPEVDLVEVTDLGTTERGEGGFGSTGV